MPKYNRQRHIPQKKKKDHREWTTPDQKAHLQSRQGGYGDAQKAKTVSGWFSIELEIYFNKFPTQPITAEERNKHPNWTLHDKRLREEEVSGWNTNEKCEHLP